MLRRLPSERQPLRECVGRILREDVMPERDNPPFDRVCMDGIAIASASFERGQREFTLQATQAAGAQPLALASPDAGIEVMTGAVLPAGADCIVPLEEYTIDGRTLRLGAAASARAWRNVQRRGEDSRPGVAMLHAGIRLGAAEIAVLASSGQAQAQVACRPRIAVVSTGDELVEPGDPIEAHQVRRSNAYAVLASLHAHGYAEAVDEHLRDDATLMRERLGQLLERNEVLVLSGGVSTGKFDFVPAALGALGVREIFHEVAQRPGRPLWFGVGPEGQAVFGLPGNPVATLVCLVRFVLPALRTMMGAAEADPLRHPLAAAFGGRKMTYFLPVRLMPGSGGTVAEARAPNGPGDFLALAGTAGFLELPPAPTGYAAGFVADFHPW